MMDNIEDPLDREPPTLIYIMGQITRIKHSIIELKKFKKLYKKQYHQCKRLHGRFDRHCSEISDKIDDTKDAIRKEMFYRRKLINNLHKINQNRGLIQKVRHLIRH